MFGLYWHNLNNQVRGIIIMVFGIILLLYTLDILQQWLTWFLIIFAVALIIYGFIEARFWNQIKALLEKPKKGQ